MHTDPYGLTRLMPGRPAMRALRGLWRMGWTNDDLSARYSIPRPMLDAVLDGCDQIGFAVHDQVMTMWRELRNIPGPCWQAAQQGIKLGWPAAYLWTEADLDAAPDWLEDYPAADAAPQDTPESTRGGKVYPGAVKLRTRVLAQPHRARAEAKRRGRPRSDRRGGATAGDAV